METQFTLKKIENYFTFELNNQAGDTLLFGGEYTSKDEAEADIKAVQVGSLMSPQIAAAKTKDGSKFFVIKSSNGDILAKSALFDNTMEFDNTLHQVKDSACVASVVDQSE